MLKTKQQEIHFSEGKIVIRGSNPPALEDKEGNSWNLRLCDFYFPHLADNEGSVKFPRPFRYTDEGKLIERGVIFPILFRNNQNPVILPLGKFTLGNGETSKTGADGFDLYDTGYTNFDETKTRIKNHNRTILKTLDSEGNIQKQILITDNGEEVGQLNVNITRAGKVTIDLLSNSGAFSADLELNADGKADITIKGDANISVNGNSNLSVDGNITLNCGGNSTLTIEGDVSLTANGKVDLISDNINLGGNQQFKIALAETISNLFNAHTHLSAAPGSPTGPPLQPMTAQQIGSGKHTVDQ